LIQKTSGIRFSVSYTTRSPRRGERHGVDYFFVSGKEFERLRRKKEFLEWARVDGECYGTSRRQAAQALERGEDLLLEIDTQGAEQVRRRMQREAVLIFVLPPSPAALRLRHRKRGSSSEAVDRRLVLARREVRQFGMYDYLIFNVRVEEACRHLEGVVRAERCRTRRQRERARQVVRAFQRGGTVPRRTRPAHQGISKETPE